MAAEKNVVKEVIGALEEDGVSDDMIGLREGLYSAFAFFLYLYECNFAFPF